MPWIRSQVLKSKAIDVTTDGSTDGTTVMRTKEWTDGTTVMRTEGSTDVTTVMRTEGSTDETTVMRTEGSTDATTDMSTEAQINNFLIVSHILLIIIAFAVTSGLLWSKSSLILIVFYLIINCFIFQ